MERSKFTQLLDTITRADKLLHDPEISVELQRMDSLTWTAMSLDIEILTRVLRRYMKAVKNHTDSKGDKS